MDNHEHYKNHKTETNLCKSVYKQGSKHADKPQFHSIWCMTDVSDYTTILQAIFFPPIFLHILTENVCSSKPAWENPFSFIAEKQLQVKIISPNQLKTKFVTNSVV